MDIEEQYDKIYHYCYFKIYDKQLAQDITQETFLRFYKQEFNDSSYMYLYRMWVCLRLVSPYFIHQLLFCKYSAWRSCKLI